ncbi:TPA: agmatinase [archaeon]|nr:agmatinase [Candidatus Naiadarchaeales archaeon SRR2090153.bin461]
MNVPDNFLGLEESFCDYKKSKVVVASAPYESTVTYGKGTKNGPRAIIEASKNLELWDEELKLNIVEKIGGVATIKPYKLPKKPEEMVSVLERETKKLIRDEKFVLTLGGEHSIAVGPAKAYSDSFKNLSVLYFDAHGDLREEYGNSKFSHACALKRITDFNKSFVHVGCRSISDEEAELIEKENYKVAWAHEFKRGKVDYDFILNNLKENVYISFDIDAFDQSIMPATGTPEPGGINWYDAITIIRKVSKEKNIVGADINELAPINGLHAADFLAAKLAYKIIGYSQLKI